MRTSGVEKSACGQDEALNLLACVSLLMEDRFARIWAASPAAGDVRQVLRWRHNLFDFADLITERGSL